MSPSAIEVRYKTGYAVFQIVGGAVLGVLGFCLAGFPGTGYAIVMLVPAIMLIATGIAALNRPYCSFDPETEALYLHPPLFGSPRPVGGSKGGRVYRDDDKIVREFPNGKQRAINLSMFANEEDVARLKQALPPGPA